MAASRYYVGLSTSLVELVNDANCQAGQAGKLRNQKTLDIHVHASALFGTSSPHTLSKCIPHQQLGYALYEAVGGVQNKRLVLGDFMSSHKLHPSINTGERPSTTPY